MLKAVTVTEVKDFLKEDREQKAKEWDSMFKRYLQYEDEELLLLKGHLMIEQALNESLQLFFKEGKQVEELRLTFDKKLNLAVALIGEMAFERVFSQIKELNAIRNKLAHHLDSCEYHEDLMRWASNSLYSDHRLVINNDKEYKENLIKNLAYIIGYINSLTAFFKNFHVKHPRTSQ